MWWTLHTKCIFSYLKCPLSLYCRCRSECFVPYDAERESILVSKHISKVFLHCLRFNVRVSRGGSPACNIAGMRQGDPKSSPSSTAIEEGNSQLCPFLLVLPCMMKLMQKTLILVKKIKAFTCQAVVSRCLHEKLVFDTRSHFHVSQLQMKRAKWLENSSAYRNTCNDRKVTKDLAVGTPFAHISSGKLRFLSFLGSLLINFQSEGSSRLPSFFHSEVQWREQWKSIGNWMAEF